MPRPTHRILHLVSPPTGVWGERRAARYLRRQGLRILGRNYRVRAGELDLIALEHRTLVFVEVKTVSSHTRMWGFDRVDAEKQRRLARAAAAYIRQSRTPFDRWRFDIVVVEYAKGRWCRRVRGVHWYPAAFDAL